MRKLLFSIITVSLIAVIIISSCSKDEFTEADALEALNELNEEQNHLDSLANINEAIRDSLNHAGGVIQYSISVVDATDAGFTKSSKGLDSCEVTVNQYGVAVTVTTNNGIAVFNDLRIGAVSVNIQETGYTGVDFIAELAPIKDTIIVIDTCCGTIDYYNIHRCAATMVPIFNVSQPSASTIEGQLSYESDLTNNTPEYMANAEVIASIDVDHNDFRLNYLDPVNNANYTGEIIEIAYSSIVFRTQSDAEGNYFLDVPSTADGLQIRINVSEYSVTQTLLMNTLYGVPTYGEQQTRTIFVSGKTPSYIPVVPGAYITFSTPTGTPAEQPDNGAIADAVLTNSGIESVNITNAGNFYTQTPVLKVTEPLATEGKSAIVHAVLTNGKVTDVVIDDAGSGYAPDQTVSVVEDANYSPSGAAGTPKITYSIINIPVTNAAANVYNSSTPPNIIINSSAGTGASAQAVMTGYVYEGTLTNGGSGYICAPDLIVESSPTGNPTDDATGTIDMTDYNPIYRIDYIAATPTKYETTPAVEIRSSGVQGGGASAIAILKTQGNVKQINLINPGNGYDQNVPPAVYISGGDGAGATAYATVAADGTISAITIGDIGFGYTSANSPTVTIAAPPSGGTTATADIVLEFELDRIDLTNSGAGYNVTYDHNTGADTNEPGVFVDNVIIADNDVVVYPNMSVEDVTISGGKEYTTAPTVTIRPVCGAGSGATATTTLKYRVKELTMITEGNGYESPSSDISIVAETPADGCPVRATFGAPGLGKAVLESITLTDGGINYSAAPIIKLVTGGNDAGPVITAIVSDGSVTQFNVSDGTIARSYDTPGEALISSFSVQVTYFTAQATFSGNANPLSGQVEYINITTPGNGYKSVPIVEIVRNGTVSSGDFVDAQAEAIVTDGRVTAINITNPGTGYYSTPVINLIVKNYVETAKGSCVINYNTGRITGVNFAVAGGTSGAGYIIAPTITFTANLPGIGDGAEAIAVISGGAVNQVIMTNQGQGYLGRNYWIPTGSSVPAYPGSGGTSGANPTNLPGTGNEDGCNYGSLDGNTITVYSGRNYVRDLYMGTGFRSVNQ